MSFVNLRVHSNFSMLAGTRPIGDLVRAAARFGMPAMALTDTDSMGAVVPFRRACEETGIQPIYGVEITERRNAPGTDRVDRKAKNCRGYEAHPQQCRPAARAVLLARTRDGYGELCRLVTRRHLGEDFSLGRELESVSENVFVLADDERLLRRLGGRQNVFVMLPVASGIEWIEQRRRLRGLAAELGLKTVAVGEVFFLEPSEYFIHRVLAAIRTRTTVGTLAAGAVAAPSSFFHSPHLVKRVFYDDPLSVNSAVRIAEECRFDLDLDTLKLPRFAVPGGENASTFLGKVARRGLEERIDATDRRAAFETLERELSVIDAKGLADYFLICWDIVRFARSRGMRSLGRGSAGNSMVSYALGVTHVNPLRHNLFFERFLNPEREHLPDFDIDFGTGDREEVLRYIFRRYGKERVAMIGTYSTLKARAALREVAKALGIPGHEVQPFIERLPFFSSVERLEEICAISPACTDIPFDREPLRTILRIAVKVGEFPRHMATHPCGLVVSPSAITDFVPLQRGEKGYEITQWAMQEIESAGLLKVDIIGQKGLAVIEETVAMAEENEGLPLRCEVIDCLRDAATRKALRSGRTEGCFYIESPAMIQLLRQARCEDFEVLTALSSIIRPGVSSYGGKRRYLRRHLGLEPVSFLHPMLEPVLSDTYGCLVYQEQVIRAAVIVAGMSFGQADALRRCMAFKNIEGEKMEDYRESFVRGALSRGVPHETAEEIFRQIASFAGYAFCKAHSASFALESFESLYWKTHYPAEFMAAVLSNGGGYYPQEEYLEEARRMGIEIFPPCVNESRIRHYGKDRKLRIGLMQVKNLSLESAERIVRFRPYSCLEEFIERAAASRDEVESLIRAGAFASFGRTRPELLWELRLLWPRSGGKVDKDARVLLGKLPHLAEYDLAHRVALELETLDLAVSAHPLVMFAETIERTRLETRAVRSCDLARKIGSRIGIVGWKVAWKTTRTSDTGEEMIFVTFSDEWGRFEASFFPDAYRRSARDLARACGPFLISGRVESEFGVENLVVEDLLLLSAKKPRFQGWMSEDAESY